MPKLRPHVLAAFLLLAGAAAAEPALAAQGQAASTPERYTTRYRIFHLDLHSAELLAWQQCADKTRCAVTGSTADEGGFLDVLADAATHAAIVAALAREDAAPKTQVFQLFLLEATSAEGGAFPTHLAAGARKALEDLRSFLPYKSYRLLDSAWLPATDLVRARLVGDGGASYETMLRFRRVGGPEGKQLFVHVFNMREEGTSPALVDAQGKGRPPRQLIVTSFGLDVGETIVVGTSRVDGASDKALVVLLTAVAEAAP